jgi:hypothetical protein
MVTKFEIGDIRNGAEVLQKNDRKKIIVLADDMRVPTGIGTMTREFTLGMCHRFNILQVGAGINHPDAGKMLEVSEDVQKLTGVPDPSVRILGWNGYGDAHIVRQLINMERPDAIVHFTDPRQWIWLYEIEHEIRQVVPIIYYNIWDNVPDPMYNAEYYASCDSLMAISKQTYGINHRVLTKKFGEEFNVIKR